MGVIIVLPFLGLCSWVLWTTFVRLKLEIFDHATRRAFWTQALIGLAVGIWSGLFLRYHPAATFELTGFPFPVKIVHLDAGLPSSPSPPPFSLAVRGTCLLANLIFAAMAASLPVTISSYLKDWKRNTPQPSR